MKKKQKVGIKRVWSCIKLMGIFIKLICIDAIMLTAPLIRWCRAFWRRDPRDKDAFFALLLAGITGVVLVIMIISALISCNPFQEVCIVKDKTGKTVWK